MADFLYRRKVFGEIFREGKKVTQTKTGRIFLFPLLFRRYFNIKVAFGGSGAEDLHMMILSICMVRIRESE